jgi:hypothetical protein
MTTTATPDPDFAIPEQARPFQKAFNCLMEKMKLRVFPLLTSFGTWVVPATPKEDRRQTRLITASDWLIALMRIFSGDTKYMRPWTLPRWKPFGGRRSPQILAACGVKPSTSKSTEAQRERARYLYMLKVFATVPTGKIAMRLARRFGIKKNSDYWPRSLIEIHETPRAFCFRNYVKPNRVNNGIIEPPPPPPPPEPPKPKRPRKPPFHKRE